ncbi:hypothetical protein AN619_27470 [Thermotalea metallivorans]|uniref:Nitrous oxide-stimulated promoter n=2 Tax=Thermotalea metallivorans TaxID=520762 RepID=A0A140L063_9FIRM|nr:hypothetical protein AN619_27470 [Thermotalea metallivorans]
MKKDIFILIQFIHVYCRYKHIEREKTDFSYHSLEMKKQVRLCEECSDLAVYSINRRIRCPMAVKPACKKCSIKCYAQEYREKIKKVMKFSGMYFIRRGRIDYLFKYFFR